ncbi:hypothetical protein VO63_12285 [Streptomyces showdoensis]|uniref:SCP domain-containing protein n=1 Tax=Streptomyces showdoensis TaxID=68268 RepID=A0A2P2GRP7_STREW|nr:hypothetical protein VO63_12285 [Streptomyces showdoensis]
MRAAQYGDTWAREQLMDAYQPLVQALAARALHGRPGADAAVYAVVRDTLGRAEFALGTLPSPDAFRPWLVGIGVASVLAHAAGLPAGTTPGALCWLDAEDAVLVALGSLEETGLLGRHETAAALSWSPQDVALRLETVRVRLDAARSVTTALARGPRCPVLAEQAGTWDGRPGAAWRDHLARHTAQCGHCATGIAAPRATGSAPGYAVADPGAAGPSVPAAAAAGTAGVAGGAEALAATETFAAVPSDAADELAPAGWDATAAAGRRSTRAGRRRRRQADERNRRRVVVAAGLAVVAVTGGAFTLNAGRGGDGELLEAGRAGAPDLDLRLSNEPGTLTASPSATTASPSATGAPTTPKKPTTTPSKAPKTATTTPAAKRTAAPVRTTKAPAPTKTASTPARDGRQDSGQKSNADQVIALVNAERAKVGCGALTANATLTKAAQGHSDDMAARDFFDHTNPDGDGPGERVTAAGYPWTTYGENIAMGQSSPEAVMEAWMNSPGHRANILNCDFKEIGIGIHNSGGPYWTQVFGAR